MKFSLRLLGFAFLAAGAACMNAAGLLAQEAPQGPMEAPAEHHVSRISTDPEPPAPPSLPVEEIIRRFSQKEEEYVKARPNYGFRKSIRIQEFGPDGSPVGEFLRISDYIKMADGRITVKAVEHPQSTLQGIYLAPEDLDALDRVPAYPLIASQLRKYELIYLGKEQVDEVDCYIFQAKPKAVERNTALFDGVVWVDAKYLEVVKTYGKFVTDMGDTRGVAQLPFSLFETYRENVDGKYWFPNYLRSDDTLHVKDENIPVRLVVKWTEFKPAAVGNAAGASTPASAAPPTAAPTAPAPPPANPPVKP